MKITQIKPQRRTFNIELDDFTLSDIRWALAKAVDVDVVSETNPIVVRLKAIEAVVDEALRGAG